MIRRTGTMKPEEVFSRTLFGIILIAASFVAWGKWVALVLGGLFLFSALSGVCLTCELYKAFFKDSQKPSSK